GYTPTQIATVLLCSRSSVYRAVTAYRQGAPEGLTEVESCQRASALTPSLRRSLLALLNKAPAACGWCRTPWSGATLAAQLCYPGHRSFSVTLNTAYTILAAK